MPNKTKSGLLFNAFSSFFVSVPLQNELHLLKRKTEAREATHQQLFYSMMRDHTGQDLMQHFDLN